jgi:hypothetical protein
MRISMELITSNMLMLLGCKWVTIMTYKSII